MRVRETPSSEGTDTWRVGGIGQSNRAHLHGVVQLPRVRRHVPHGPESVAAFGANYMEKTTANEAHRRCGHVRKLEVRSKHVLSALHDDTIKDMVVHLQDKFRELISFRTAFSNLTQCCWIRTCGRPVAGKVRNTRGQATRTLCFWTTAQGIHLGLASVGGTQKKNKPLVSEFHVELETCFATTSSQNTTAKPAGCSGRFLPTWLRIEDWMCSFEIARLC